ncbi:unnamed protein product [Prunus armeniaca]|uniref:Uncharacterized protein n=1 Tax=Prunus armeniaca TaxID=36596 RepID=A0A6J5TJ34_PRUAR|nr:unnamed protein product [Prunus armeniaca]
MLSIIDGSEPCPPQYLPIQEGSLTSTTNPEFVQWMKQDLKGTADSLAATGSPLDDIDFVAHVLNGLPSDYDSFATSIRVRSEPITSEELHALLLSEEFAFSSRLSSFSEPTSHAFQTSLSSQPHLSKTNSNNRYSNQARSFSNSSHPNPNPNSRNPQHPFRFSRPQHTSHPNPNHNLNPTRSFFRPNNYFTPRIVCQICNKPDHGALTCKNRLNSSYQGHFPSPNLSPSHSTTPSYPFASYTSIYPSSSST